MPLFLYKGQDASSGKKTKGVIEAESLREAKIKLRKQNVYVLAIQIDNKVEGAEDGASFLVKLNRKPPKPEDIALATKQLSILIKAAVDINESLKAVSEQIENQELKAVYVRMRELVSEGKTLSDAHRQFPKVFTSIYVNMIAAAEKAGALPLVLQRLSEFQYYQIEIRRKLVGALTYPAFMIMAAIGVTMYLFVSVLPKMSASLKSMKVTLPWYTIVMNDISKFLQEWWIVIMSIFVAGVVSLVAWSKTAKGKDKLDEMLYNAPIIGLVVQKVTLSRFSKTLSTVLSSGVRIVEALQLTKMVVGNSVIEKAITDTISRVQDGDKLAMALEKTGKFPVMVLHMLRTGEKTGKIEDMLFNIAEVYDDDVDSQITQTTKLIEPLMLVFMAGMVFLLVMSILGPMMSAMDTIQ